MTNLMPDHPISANGGSTNGASANGANANGDNPADATPNLNVGSVRPADIVGEMQTAYLDYAMSVIVARALPDVRDGLKPVHRRILYAMAHDLYLTHDKPHKKSARIVGEVLGKYHPHGDVAVYDAMVRMAQEFSLRYPLIDGQGNFGSIDGDGAAAMRYTEARLAEISTLMLADLDKDTVDWHDNFDNSLQEPDILPAALPNLLVNGASGIAVGMATNIPPHNLGEVVDALVHVIDNHARLEEITVEDLMQFIKGPDFPTGGILYRYREDGKGEETTDAIAQGYSVGKSRLILQAKAHFEEMSRGRMRIVVTELPYQTNKTALIERIATLARDGKLEGITDLRDESDRTGMRIVIELNRNTDPKATLSDLFKYTPLQQTFGLQMLALLDGQPRMLSLKRVLAAFIQHRQEIIRRRSEFDLQRARDRAHIVEGLLRALDILDEVIDTIRRSQNVETARNNLMKNFQFTQIQAQAILDMQLRRLAALERKKLKDEYDELLAQIAYLEDLLAHPEKILAVIRGDLLAQKEKYGDARRTQIVDRTKGTLTTTDLLPQQDVWVTVSAGGDLRRQDLERPTVATLRKLGKAGQVAIVNANTRDWLYLFGRDGRCTRVAIHEIPQDGSPKHVADLTEFTRRDQVTAAVAFPRLEGAQAAGYLFFATAQGLVKRVTLADFLAPVSGDFVAMAVEEKDRLDWALVTTGQQEIMLVTASGQSIRFREEDVRSMGLAAGGVGGIKLQPKDRVIYAAVVDPQGALVTMTTQGYAKRSPLSDYSGQGRNGSGIVTHKPTARTGDVAAALMLSSSVKEGEVLVAVTAKQAVKAVPLADIPLMGRGVQGKAVLEDLGNDQVAGLLRVQEEAETPSPESKPPTPASPPPSPTKASTPDRTDAKAPAATATRSSAPKAAALPLNVVAPPKGSSATAPTAAPTPTAVAEQPATPTRAVAEERKTSTSAAKPSNATTVTANQPKLPAAEGRKPTQMAAPSPTTKGVAEQSRSGKAAAEPDKGPALNGTANPSQATLLDAATPAKVSTTASQPRKGAAQTVAAAPEARPPKATVAEPSTQPVNQRTAKGTTPSTKAVLPMRTPPSQRTAPSAAPRKSTTPATPQDKAPAQAAVAPQSATATKAAPATPRRPTEAVAMQSKGTEAVAGQSKGTEAGSAQRKNATTVVPEPSQQPQRPATSTPPAKASVAPGKPTGSQANARTASSSVGTEQATLPAVPPATASNASAKSQAASKPTQARPPLTQPRTLELFPLDEKPATPADDKANGKGKTGVSSSKTENEQPNTKAPKQPKMRKLQVAVSVPKTKRK